EVLASVHRTRKFPGAPCGAGIEVAGASREGRPLARPRIGAGATRASYVTIVRCAMAPPPLYWTSGQLLRKAAVWAARIPLGHMLSIPNLITLARILMVPIIVWAITGDHMLLAFVLFLVAGLSDLVDGFLAKRFGMATNLGAYLDPLADKAMIVSIYVALGITEAIPRWLVILVVCRDIILVSPV